MNRFLPALGLLAIILSFAPAALAQPAVGAPAPAFTAKDSAGREVSLADFKGTRVVLEWTSSECPFVHKHYDSGNMQKLQKAAAADGVVWLSVDSSAPGKPGHMEGAAADAWLKKEDAAPAHFLIDEDGALGRLYGAKTTPHMFVIDAQGKLAYAGAIDSKPSVDAADIAGATNYVTAALAALKEGKAVDPAVTTSYGCGVKY